MTLMYGMVNGEASQHSISAHSWFFLVFSVSLTSLRFVLFFWFWKGSLRCCGLYHSTSHERQFIEILIQISHIIQWFNWTSSVPYANKQNVIIVCGICLSLDIIGCICYIRVFKAKYKLFDTTLCCCAPRPFEGSQPLQPENDQNLI